MPSNRCFPAMGALSAGISFVFAGCEWRFLFLNKLWDFQIGPILVSVCAVKLNANKLTMANDCVFLGVSQNENEFRVFMNSR